MEIPTRMRADDLRTSSNVGSKMRNSGNVDRKEKDNLVVGTPNHGSRLDFGSHVGDRPKNFWALIHTIWPSGHNVYEGQLFSPKLKFGLIQH